MGPTTNLAKHCLKFVYYKDMKLVKYEIWTSNN